MVHLFENLAHLVGLPLLVLLYTVRILVLLRRRMAKDRSIPKANQLPGILWSYLTIFMPWSMESTSKNWGRYLEFVIFHIGVFTNILVSFIVSYATSILETPLRQVFTVLIIAAALMALIRLIRRVVVPKLKIISTPDDYASLLIAILFLASGIPAMYGSDSWLLIYFLITFVFLIYEPFSKIRHYIYFPFARYFYGAFMGSRNMVGKRR